MKKQGTTKERQKIVEAQQSTEPQPSVNNAIDTVYLVTKAGIEVRDGIEAESAIKEIKRASGDDDTPYIFFEDGRPVYLAVKASVPRPLVFPEPGPDIVKGQYGVTSVELYGWAVTLAETIARIVEGETKGKPSLMMEAKKIMTLALPIVAAVFAIFIMAVLLKG